MFPEILCFTHSKAGTVFTGVEASPSSRLVAEYIKPPAAPLRSRWHPIVEKEVTAAIVQKELPDLYQRLPSIPEGLILFFWTSVSSMRIYIDEGRGKTVSQKATLGQQEDSYCEKHPHSFNGVPQYWVGSLNGPGDMTWEETLSTGHHDEEKLHDFIVVSRSHTDAVTESLIVMQVRWRGTVAMRCNVGTVTEAAWVASSPRWQLVALG